MTSPSARVIRNFWLLVAAAVVAVGLLSRALELPAGPLAALVTATSATAAVLALALAGRILVVTSRHRGPRRTGCPVRRGGPSGARTGPR